MLYEKEKIPLFKTTTTLLLLLCISTTAQAKLQVVATLPDLAAIAKEVGGEHITVVSLASPTEDPHYVDPRPSLMLTLNRADLLLETGLELEIGWLPSLVKNARNRKIQKGSVGSMDLSTVVQRLGSATSKVDRSHGDVHPGGNPHYTYDPTQGARIALALGKKLAEIDPPNDASYKSRAKNMADELKDFANAQATRFASLSAQQRKVVTYHKSFIYLQQWLSLEAVGHVEPKPGIAPGPSHVAKLLQRMRQQGVRVILQEEHYPQNTSRSLSQLAGVQLVVLPTATRFAEGERYINHLKSITERIYAALHK